MNENQYFFSYNLKLIHKCKKNYFLNKLITWSAAAVQHCGNAVVKIRKTKMKYMVNILYCHSETNTDREAAINVNR